MKSLMVSYMFFTFRRKEEILVFYIFYIGKYVDCHNLILLYTFVCIVIIILELAQNSASL